jgi:hypothetical protein
MVAMQVLWPPSQERYLFDPCHGITKPHHREEREKKESTLHFQQFTVHYNTLKKNLDFNLLLQTLKTTQSTLFFLSVEGDSSKSQICIIKYPILNTNNIFI